MAISTNHKKYICYYGQFKDALNQCQWKLNMAQLLETLDF